MEGLEVRSCVGGYAHVSPAHEEVVTGRIALQVISSWTADIFAQYSQKLF